VTQRSLAAFISALIPTEHGGPDPDDAAARLSSYLSKVPPVMRRGVHAGTGGVDALARVTNRGRGLRAIDVDRRQRVLARVAATATGADALEGLKGVVMLCEGAHGHAPEMRAAAAAHPPARPDPELRICASTVWPSRSRADVVVVGSGAGGAMVARTLARRGWDVAVVEEGRRHTVGEFRTGEPLDRFADLYRDGAPAIALGVPPVVLPIGRGVGGTTLVNSGTCYRTPVDVLQRWHRELGIPFADPERFGPYLDEVWETIGVGPVPLEIMGRNGRTMLEGAHKLGWAAHPLQRNAPGCGGCCQCAIGCPRNAKAGVHLNALPQACDAGATIVAELRVSRVLHHRGRATGVLARRPDGSAVIIESPTVVVACGATESPTLLRRSGLGRHREVGRNLALHPAVATSGRFSHDITAWEGVLQSAVVEEFHQSHRILIEATSTPPGMGSMALPGYGRALLGELEASHHNVTLGGMIGDGPWGRVHGRRRGSTIVSYRLAADGGQRLLKAIEVMGQVLLAAGATEILTGIPGADPARTTGDLADLVARTDPRRLHIAAFHPTGTLRMGADEQTSPVDQRGRLRGVDGVWVADACAVPTCPDVNPQVTIMALALAVADELVAQS